MMTSCYNVGQLRPLALCIQGLPLGYRSVSVLAKDEAEGMIYITRSSLKVRNKLPPLRVGVANHHGKKDTRGEFIRPNNKLHANEFPPTRAAQRFQVERYIPSQLLVFRIIKEAKGPCPQGFHDATMEMKKINSDRLRAIGYDNRARLLQAQLDGLLRKPL